ncbi:hypothetical protein [Agromyces sp. NPDC049794]|uniref:hypothetical protein n=1 Tax=unclassified Agromyces TaxID=2639701 RepID=UPI0033DAADC0
MSTGSPDASRTPGRLLWPIVNIVAVIIAIVVVAVMVTWAVAANNRPALSIEEAGEQVLLTPDDARRLLPQEPELTPLVAVSRDAAVSTIDTFPTWVDLESLDARCHPIHWLTIPPVADIGSEYWGEGDATASVWSRAIVFRSAEAARRALESEVAAYEACASHEDRSIGSATTYTATTTLTRSAGDRLPGYQRAETIEYTLDGTPISEESRAEVTVLGNTIFRYGVYEPGLLLDEAAEAEVSAALQSRLLKRAEAVAKAWADG